MKHKKHHSKASPGGHGTSEHEGARVGAGHFANMPTEVRMDMYPKAPADREKGLDDTMHHIDHVNHHAESQERKYMSYQH